MSDSYLVYISNLAFKGQFFTLIKKASFFKLYSSNVHVQKFAFLN